MFFDNPTGTCAPTPRRAGEDYYHRWTRRNADRSRGLAIGAHRCPSVMNSLSLSAGQPGAERTQADPDALLRYHDVSKNSGDCANSLSQRRTGATSAPLGRDMIGVWGEIVEIE